MSILRLARWVGERIEKGMKSHHGRRFPAVSSGEHPKRRLNFKEIKMHGKPIGIALLIVFLISFPASAEFYKYIGPDGVIHFTDNLCDVPENQRSSLEEYSEAVTPEESMETLPTATVTQKIAEREKIKESESAERQNDIEARAEKLVKLKAELDQEFRQLTDEKERFEKEKKSRATSAEMKVYERQAEELNDRIKAYEEKSKHYKEELKAYHAMMAREFE